MSPVEHAPTPDPPPAAPRAAGRITIVEQHPDTAAGTPAERTADHQSQEPGRLQAVSVAPGLLVAVCGVQGGAGVSTLAFLLARFEQRTLAEVLVADTGGPGGGIARLAGVHSARSLEELAQDLHAGLPARQPVATAACGLRVLATPPRFATTTSADGVRALLEQARERYPLTVVDCGTLARPADQTALAAASHAVWLLPATSPGAERARILFDAINPHPREILAARQHPNQSSPVRQLKRLAGERAAPLVLLPTLPDPGNHQAVDRALDTWQVPLQAIHGLLHRNHPRHQT